MNKYITSSPEIMGGQPVISGTRVPISIILRMLKDNYTIEDVTAMYNHVPREKIEHALEEIAQHYSNGND